MDFWEYVMFDRPVSITGQRSARKMKEPPPTARRRKLLGGGERRARDGKKAVMEAITEENYETPRRRVIC